MANRPLPKRYSKWIPGPAITLIGKLQGKYILKTEFPEYRDKYGFIEPPIEIREHYIAISKKAKDYNRKLDDFNRGLKMIWKDGTFDKILIQHGME